MGVITRFSLVLLVLGRAAFALEALPPAYTELLDYVMPGPDQGETNACLFVGSTGAMELLLNKHYGIKHPKPMSDWDLSETFLIHAPNAPDWYTWLDAAVLKFNRGFAIRNRDLPFEAWKDPQHTIPNWDSWYWPPGFYELPRARVFPIETELLFMRGRNKWATYVLWPSDIEKVKAALVRDRSPILVNYNDEYYWHVISIVGYDDNAVGSCYGTPKEECPEGKKGTFYVRDSAGGPAYEKRAYDWFRVNGNAATVVREAKVKGQEL